MKNKILFMVQLPPPIHGASLRNKSLVDSKLLNDSFEIKVLPLMFASDVKDIGSIGFRKIIKMFKYIILLIIDILSFRPDLAYFTISPVGGAFYRDVLYVVILKLFRIKILYHLRGKGIDNASKKNFINTFIYRYVFKNTDVICLSEIPIQDIKNVYFNKPFIVNNGIKVEIKDDEIIYIDNEIIEILFLSNLAKEKGILEFINALKILNDKKNNFHVNIIGSEFDIAIEELEKIVEKLKLESKVDVLGPKYNSEKKEYLLKADIFVFPTYYRNEVFPGVILEAMQASKPIVTTFEASIPDIVDEGINGFMVKQKDVISLAEKIEILIKDANLRKKMGKAGREKFLEKYTLEKFENNMKKTFKEVLNK